MCGRIMPSPAALSGAGQHPPCRYRRPRLPGLVTMQLHQQHPVIGAATRVFGGDVVEVGVDHRRADPFDQSTAHGLAVDAPGVFGLRLGAVRVARAVTHVQVRAAALPARGVAAQMQVDQMQPTQLADPQAPVAQPGYDEAIPGRSHRRRAFAPGHRRAASSDAAAAAPAAPAGWPAPTSWHGPGTVAAGRHASATACGRTPCRARG